MAGYLRLPCEPSARRFAGGPIPWYRIHAMSQPATRSVTAAVALLGAVFTACSGDRTGPRPDAALVAMIDSSLARAAEQYGAMDESLPDTLFPRTLHADGTLRTNTSRWWTSGFFPGSLWYLYEHTGDPELRARAEARTRALEREQRNAADHDIGFKIMSSFGHGWRLTGDSAHLPVIRTAARTLATRFDPRVGAIRSWGEHPDTASPYLVIIDNMMNLELLFRAADLGADPELFDIAVRHADTTLRHHFRPDGSSYHVVEYDPVSGAVLRKRTEQGAADSSAWARGQAWGLYGYTVAFRETGYDRYLRQAREIADFILTHPSLPADGVPYWDFHAPGIPNALRDASAAAITASALLELSGYVRDSLRTAYREYARATLTTLSHPPYRTELGESANFLLKHGVGHRPADSEVDVPLSYADYYYLEGLLRLRRLLTGSDLEARIVPLGAGWARSSVNAVIFRERGLVTHGDTRLAAYYDPDGRVILARRRPGEHWTTRRTRYSGDVADAHNAISIAVDGNGVLHMAWDLHDDTLRYVRGTGPGELALTDPLPMTGRHEDQVSYPQFYRLDDGDLLFLYRSGGSGAGDVMLDRYDTDEDRWMPVHHPLIDGGGERSAYVNRLALDRDGGLHLSWTWRESWDVATNHDILYAYSPDGGRSWQRSGGEAYALPITAPDAEVAVSVPQGRSLINQTTMAVDGRGRPHIASYWRPEGTDGPTYHHVWHDGARWNVEPVGQRHGSFDLAGAGTRRIPISRPLILTGPDDSMYMVFRDFERGGGVSVTASSAAAGSDWRVAELYRPALGLWEPVHDPVAWRATGTLRLLIQHVGQGQGETLEALPPQPVKVLEWNARRFIVAGEPPATP